MHSSDVENSRSKIMALNKCFEAFSSVSPNWLIFGEAK